jgi:pimeloyl-ACP methyl ester carboxylesterase
MAEDEAVRAAAAMDAHAAPQQRVKINTRRRINLSVMGEGSPAVVLAAGANGSTFDSFRVMPLAASFARVVAFDRAGMGFSDPGPLPLDASAVVADLRAALKAAGMAPPYVLVGHSWGGVEMTLYALKHPEEVAGLILVDSSTVGREQLAEWKAQRRQAHAERRRIETLVRTGQFRRGLPEYESRIPPPWATPAIREVLHGRLISPTWWRAFGSEIQSQPRSAREVTTAWRSLRETPLIDLLAARNEAPDWAAATKNQDHDAIARLSARSERRVVNSGHHIPFHRPQAVVDAVRDVLSMLPG